MLEPYVWGVIIGSIWGIMAGLAYPRKEKIVYVETPNWENNWGYEQ